MNNHPSQCEGDDDPATLAEAILEEMRSLEQARPAPVPAQQPLASGCGLLALVVLFGATCALIGFIVGMLTF